MKPVLLYGVLALRVALAWWVLLVAVTAVFSDLAGLGALLVYPPLALLLGGLAAWLQHRGLSALSAGVNPLTVEHQQSISLPLSAVEALRLASGAIKASFGQQDQRITEDSITTSVIERGHRTTGLAAWRSDQLTLVSAGDGPGLSLLQISCRPLHGWLYRVFWVDAGRCARQVVRLRKSLLARVRSQGEAASALAQQTEMQSRLAQAELLLLRAQIEPHFLFNTLAHVRTSIESQPNAAQAMLDALIEFLRANSRTVSRADIGLLDELQRVEAYLKIMQLRLGERLSCSVQCSPSLHALQVPAACALILVENAVKHGIERRDKPGSISVSCRANNGTLEIDVENDGPGLALSHRGGGEGLNNLRQRLKMTYGDGARMSIEDRDQGGVRASLRMPMAEADHVA